jgi:ribosomal protein L40E
MSASEPRRSPLGEDGELLSPQSIPEPEGDPIYCIHCGEANRADARYCRNCGSNLEEQKISEEKQKAKRLAEPMFDPYDQPQYGEPYREPMNDPYSDPRRAPRPVFETRGFGMSPVFFLIVLFLVLTFILPRFWGGSFWFFGFFIFPFLFRFLSGRRRWW